MQRTRQDKTSGGSRAEKSAKKAVLALAQKQSIQIAEKCSMDFNFLAGTVGEAWVSKGRWVTACVT